MEQHRKPSIIQFPNPESVQPQSVAADEIVGNHGNGNRFVDWLSRQTRLLLVIGCIALAGFAIMSIFRWVNARTTAKHLAVYQTKTTLQEQVAWAESATLPHDLKPLQGFIFLEQANDCMAQKAFDRAMQYYQRAQQHVTIAPFSEQALCGYGFAAIQAQQWGTAEAALQNLTRSKSQYMQARAWYGLCYIAMQKKDAKGIENCKKQLKTFPQLGEDLLQRLEWIDATRGSELKKDAKPSKKQATAAPKTASVAAKR
jgi:tetratricopeptide (TPR) repeat protein